MSKCKAESQIDQSVKHINTSQHFVYYSAARKSHKVTEISPTNSGNRPIYKFFINYDNMYYPSRCMLGLGSTRFVISPKAAKAFKRRVVKRTKKLRSNDVTGQHIQTEGLSTVPLGLSCGNHRSYDGEDHAFEVMKTCDDYDYLIPAWYLEQHKAEATTTSHLHVPHCGAQCYGHEKSHPEYSITYDKTAALNQDAIHIGSLVQSTPSLLDRLPIQYH